MKIYKILSIIALVLGSLVPASARQSDPAPEDPAHDELRALRRDLIEAINRKDLETLLRHLDEHVVVTWADGRVSRTPQGVRDYIEQMTEGPDRILDSFRTDPEVEDLTQLYGDSGIAFGNSRDEFILTNGQAFTLDTRWTATMVRQDGGWRLASFHVSAGIFDNPVLHLAMRRVGLMAGTIAGLLGVAIGVVVNLLWTRRHRGNVQRTVPPQG